jgi:hypothetical protein
MLPLLQQHIKNTQLEFFAKYFVPLAQELKQLHKQALDSGMWCGASKCEHVLILMDYRN